MNVAHETLKSFPLFNDFSAPDLEKLSAIVEERSFAQGDFIFHEGDGSNEIFFIAAGEVEFLMKELQSSEYRKLASSSVGDMFGEMAFLDDSGRSATARAVQPTRLYCLRKVALQGLPDSIRLEKDLTAKIAQTLALRLKRENRAILANAEKDRQHRQRQHEFGQFFIYVLVCFAMGMMINRLLFTEFSGVNVYADIFTWSYLGVLLVPGLVLIKKWNIPWERVGVTLKDWKRSCGEGVIASVLLALVFALVVLVVKVSGVMALKPPNFDILK